MQTDGVFTLEVLRRAQRLHTLTFLHTGALATAVVCFLAASFWTAGVYGPLAPAYATVGVGSCGFLAFVVLQS